MSQDVVAGGGEAVELSEQRRDEALQPHAAVLHGAAAGGESVDERRPIVDPNGEIGCQRPALEALSPAVGAHQWHGALKQGALPTAQAHRLAGLEHISEMHNSS